MSIETNVEPVGTGQQGAVSPTVGKGDVPVHLEGQPDKTLDHAADRAARKGIERQHREDPTEFTK